MNKKAAIAIAVALPVALVLNAFFFSTLAPICILHESKISDHSHFFRDAVKQNPNLKAKPLTELSMLGSHDALSNDINFFSRPNSSEVNPLANNPIVYTLGKGALVRYAKAQQHNIYDQLRAGVRYIDARITYLNGQYYTSHGLVSNTLKNNLELILKFLHENSGEFIIFDINNYYPSTSSFKELDDYIDSIRYAGKNIKDYVHYTTSYNNFGDLTYQIVTEDGKEAGVVLVTDQDNAPLPYSQFYDAPRRGKHHNMASPTGINKAIIKEAEYCKTLSNRTLKVNQTQQSASEKEIWTSYVNWSLLRQAKYHNADVLDLKEIDFIIDAMPIYLADYVTSDYKDFNNRIIKKMMTRNVNL